VPGVGAGQRRLRVERLPPPGPGPAGPGSTSFSHAPLPGPSPQVGCLPSCGPSVTKYFSVSASPNRAPPGLHSTSTPPYRYPHTRCVPRHTGTRSERARDSTGVPDKATTDTFSTPSPGHCRVTPPPTGPMPAFDLRENLEASQHCPGPRGLGGGSGKPHSKPPYNVNHRTEPAVAGHAMVCRMPQSQRFRVEPPGSWVPWIRIHQSIRGPGHKTG